MGQTEPIAQVHARRRSRGAVRPRVILGVPDDPFEATEFFAGFAALRLGGVPVAVDFCRMERAALLDLAAYVPPIAAVLLNPERSTSTALIERGVRVVSVDGTDDPPHCLRLQTDHVAVGRLGARHLLDQGFRRLHFVGPGYRFAEERARGFVEVANRRGAEATVTLFPGVEWRDLIVGHCVPDVLDRMEFPAAVMAANDDIAARVVEVAVGRGLAVPGDLAVMGVDNRRSRIEVAGVGLSTISLERKQAGRKVARLLQRVVAAMRPGDREETVRLVPTSLIPRQSTQFVQFRDHRINEAIAYILRHACDGIGVQDVALACAMSVSTLHRLFRDATGRTPADEIRQARLKVARRLVEGSSKSLSEIGVSCGFSSTSYMTQAFVRAFGVPPGRLRQAKRRSDE